MTPAQRRRYTWGTILILLMGGIAVSGYQWFKKSKPASPSMTGSTNNSTNEIATASGYQWFKKSKTPSPSTIESTKMPSNSPSIPNPSTNELTTTTPVYTWEEPTDGSPIKLSFDVLTSWNYVEGKTEIPENVKKLNGRTIELTGFMMPINYTKKMTRFLLLQSLLGCCFGQTPQPNHIIIVNMEGDKTVEFYPDPVKITGKFSVGETREEGFLLSIFGLEASKVGGK
jgi:hypothetical protein